MAFTKLKRFHAKDRQDLQILCERGNLQAKGLEAAFESAFAFSAEDDPGHNRAAANLRRVMDYPEGRIPSL